MEHNGQVELVRKPLGFLASHASEPSGWCGGLHTRNCFSPEGVVPLPVGGSYEHILAYVYKKGKNGTRSVCSSSRPMNGGGYPERSFSMKKKWILLATSISIFLVIGSVVATLVLTP